MATYFVSDLHLSSERPDIMRLFNDFLTRKAKEAEAVYILGDLYEYWVGDDAVEEDEYKDTFAALRELSESGVPVYMMVGNRDFLIGEQYAQHTGCILIPDPHLVTLYGEQVLLAHGDELCTDDVEYQKIRRNVRSPALKRQFLSQSRAERHELCRGFRQQSKLATAAKPMEIMDVNQNAVTEMMRHHGVHCLVHGHTHRPNTHAFTLDGKPAKRIVLSDWYKNGVVLVRDETNWHTLTLTQDTA